MEIIEGKFYKTRDGRKVGPIRKWVGENYEWAVEYDTDPWLEGYHSRDLIAEWQDEPKKGISDMSEVKFKVGDVVAWNHPLPHGHWKHFEINKVDEKQKLYFGEDEICGSGAFCFDWDIELIKSAETVSTPEPNTKWVFNDGQDFVVRVVGFNDKGQIVLEALSDENPYALPFNTGDLFAFENEPEKFGEFYKPWVEKQKIVGCYPILRDRENGELEFGGIYQTEEQLKTDHKAFYDDSYEILDVVNVEWEQP